MSNEQKHQMLCDYLHKTYILKNNKYGNSFGKSIEEWGLTAGAVRIQDKFNRLCQLVKNKEDGSDTDESLKDTLLDMANYCIMLSMELDNKQEIFEDFRHK